MTFNTMCNDQIRVIGISIISLCWEHAKPSLLSIWKYTANYCQPVNRMVQAVLPAGCWAWSLFPHSEPSFLHPSCLLLDTSNFICGSHIRPSSRDVPGPSWAQAFVLFAVSTWACTGVTSSPPAVLALLPLPPWVPRWLEGRPCKLWLPLRDFNCGCSRTPHSKAWDMAGQDAKMICKERPAI